MNITVIIPAYNSAATIARAIASVQAQTVLPAEIIIVNDASTDKTAEIATAFAEKDKSIRIITMCKNEGAGSARNYGIEAAGSEWLAFLDADDAYTPNRLEYMLSAATHEEADAVSDNLELIDPSLDVRIGYTNFFGAKIATAVTADTFCAHDIPPQFPWLWPSGWMRLMIRREFLGKRLRYNSRIRAGQDFVFALELLLSGARLIVTPARGYHYTLPVSFIDRKKSPHSRMPDYFLYIEEAHAYVMEKYSGMPESVRKNLVRRLAGFRMQAKLQGMRGDLLRGDMLGITTKLKAAFDIASPLNVGAYLACVAFRKARLRLGGVRV